ncbi:hypothetical protein Tco_1073082 [Tanacetum coccineum]
MLLFRRRPILGVLQGVEFEVEPQEDHTFKVEPHGNVDHNAGLKEDMDVRSDVYVLSNGYRKSSDDSHDYYWEYAPAKGNILCMEIITDQSGNTMRVSQSRIHNKKLVQTLLKGHSTLSLEDSLSGDCDVEKNGKWSYTYVVGSQEYQGVCTRLDIASAYVGMLDGFDRGLQKDVQHMEALSTTGAGCMTFTEAWKKEIWLKGLLIESRYELRTWEMLLYRLYVESRCEGLDDSTVPEIKRCNLSNVILQLSAVGVDDIIGFDFMEKPDRWLPLSDAILSMVVKHIPDPVNA